MRVDRVMASSWSCVTTMKVTPSRLLNFFSSNCVSSRNFLSSAAERLVQQQEFGAFDERTRQGHALALAARELIGLALLEFTQFDEVHDLSDALVNLAGRYAVAA